MKSWMPSGRLLNLLVIGALMIYFLAPLVRLAAMSMTVSGVEPGSFSLHWYLEAATNGRSWRALLTSLLIGVAVGFASATLGLFSAHWARGLSSGKALLIAVTLAVPALMPGVVSGFSLYVFYNLIGLSGSLAAIFLGHLCYASPVAFFVLHHGVSQLDPDLEACSINLGATKFEVLRHIVWPQLRVPFVVSVILCGLLSWDEFMIAWYVGGFHQTLPVLIYGKLGSTFDSSIYAIGAFVTLTSASLMAAAFVLLRHDLPRLFSRD
jgi:spermidine/putrescine transport system permease protein